jgi:hypothetical protein
MNKKTTNESPASFLTIAELCQRWKCSHMFVHRMRQANRLKCIKLGPGAVRFQPEEIARIEQEAAA